MKIVVNGIGLYVIAMKGPPPVSNNLQIKIFKEKNLIACYSLVLNCLEVRYNCMHLDIEQKCKLVPTHSHDWPEIIGKRFGLLKYL